MGPSRTKLFIAEDDPAVRRSLQLLLHGHGYEVRAFATGAALLADPSAEEAACIIVDYRLPDGTGLDVLRALRKRGWDGPALLITAFPSSGLTAQAHAEGFCDVIEKPLLDQSLSQTVDRLTGR